MNASQLRWGLLWPGLGHLMAGEVVLGLGWSMLTLVWVIAAAAGFPRLGAIVFAGPGGAIATHGVLAVAGWIALGASLWRVAWLHAFPRQMTEEERNGNLQVFLRQMLRHRNGMIGFYGVALITIITLLTPMLAPFDPIELNVGPQYASPGWAHWMGTDTFGRDVFSRLLYGGRISLPIGFVAVGIAASLGTLAGGIAAFAGGIVDRVVMFLVDGLLSLPRLVLLITIVGLYRTTGVVGIFLIVVILGLTAWMGIARIVRSEILSLKEQAFVESATALGYSPSRILLVHLLPNALAPVIVYCSLAIGTTMLAEASLSFLGLGVPPPTPTWGAMVNEGKDALRTAPWITLFPGLTIMLAVMSFNLLGDGLRDAMDPKLRGTS